MKYATYNQKDYHLNIRNDMLRLRSNTPDPGFQELIDLAGNKHPHLYIKVVHIEEVNFAYELDFLVTYKGKEFSPYSLGRHILDENDISLFSMDSNDVDCYGFEKEEQFVFKKEVPLDDIESIIEVKKPILIFGDMPESRKVIPKEAIRDYILKLDN
ncbi:hypothetical protein [Peribacillus muralis]|uniref:hypothetical protein n=1 Tax=Peribacillus muralis TaxID=264697 RepID=UPI00070FB386|nr:hypothetical protein [Peribacillus muralis]MCK1994123.1 hypothetical protein [Peribacillus muralis]MCK2014678.1 hypothetical protein [Peribacillus muralis]